MPTRIAFVAVLGLIIAHDIKTHIKAKELTKKLHKEAKIYEQAEAAHLTQIEQAHCAEMAYAAQIDYLTYMLNRFEVEPDEFDLIALNFYS